MNYAITSFSGETYIGVGDTLHLAIIDALTKLANSELHDLGHAKLWCKAFIRLDISRRKSLLFSEASNYDIIEVIAMYGESRDYQISGVTTPARYPLARAISTARGTTLVSVLTAWGTAFSNAFTQLGILIRKQELAESAIDAATSSAALLSAMTAILEAA